MPTVRVTCPECSFSFNIADTRVGGLIACRDCHAEFRVEFAEDEPEPEADEPKPKPKPQPAPRTRSRIDPDTVPDAWKQDVPIGSPVPLLLVLIGLQVLVAGFLLLNWLYPATKGLR